MNSTKTIGYCIFCSKPLTASCRRAGAKCYCVICSKEVSIVPLSKVYETSPNNQFVRECCSKKSKTADGKCASEKAKNCKAENKHDQHDKSFGFQSLIKESGADKTERRNGPYAAAENLNDQSFSFQSLIKESYAEENGRHDSYGAKESISVINNVFNKAQDIKAENHWKTCSDEPLCKRKTTARKPSPGCDFGV